MKARPFLVSVLWAIVIVTAVACRERVVPPTPYTIEVPFGFPTRLNIPDDNPMTVEGVALGELLFNDPTKGFSVKHIKHVRPMRYLHSGSISVLVASNNLYTITLQFDGDFFA